METTENALPNQPAVAPEDAELQKLYNEFLQKCCEVGQIRYNLDQLDGQQRQMAKQLEVAEAHAKKVANQHKELQQKKFSKLKPASESPQLEIKPEASH